MVRSALRSSLRPVLARVLLTCTLGSVDAVVQPVFAQATPCDAALEPMEGNPWGYRTRGDRCEGIYAQPVAATPLVIASFTGRFDPWQPGSTESLALRWTAPAAGDVRLRAIALRRRLYYRMDATQPAAAGYWEWPTDLITTLEIGRPELGVVAWTRMPVGTAERDVHLALRIGREADDTSAAYTMVVVSQVELTEVYVTVAAQGEDGRALSYLRDEDPLGYGFYAAGRPIEIRIERPRAPGLYRVQIGAGMGGGGSPLLLAARHGDEAMVDFLLKAGADPDKGGDDRLLPITAATVMADNVTIVKALLERGANVNTVDGNAYTALLGAVWRENVELARMLLARGADPRAVDRNDRSLLFHAADKRNARLVKMLLEAGAVPKNNDELLETARNGDAAVTALLLDAGAGPCDGDVLEAAIDGRTTDVLALLLSRKCDPDSPSSEGNTALYAAVNDRLIDMVRLLLEHGADPNLEPQYRYASGTPLTRAIQLEDRAIEALLRAHGASR